MIEQPAPDDPIFAFSNRERLQALRNVMQALALFLVMGIPVFGIYHVYNVRKHEAARADREALRSVVQDNSQILGRLATATESRDEAARRAIELIEHGVARVDVVAYEQKRIRELIEGKAKGQQP
jgi:cbb3-type cytochrome oxidase subunit 3